MFYVLTLNMMGKSIKDTPMLSGVLFIIHLTMQGVTISSYWTRALFEITDQGYKAGVYYNDNRDLCDSCCLSKVSGGEFATGFKTEDFSLAGAESLVRINDAVIGRVKPEEFIPIAEMNGSIVRLEITEQNMVDAEMIEEAMNDFIQHGFRFSLDDYGSEIKRVWL